jgi:hypothetical protein
MDPKLPPDLSEVAELQVRCPRTLKDEVRRVAKRKMMSVAAFARQQMARGVAELWPGRTIRRLLHEPDLVGVLPDNGGAGWF